MDEAVILAQALSRKWASQSNFRSQAVREATYYSKNSAINALKLRQELKSDRLLENIDSLEHFRPNWQRTLLLSDLKLVLIEFVRFQLVQNCSRASWGRAIPAAR